MPRTRMTGDERRAAVLEVAIAEFARTGLHGTSTEKIAAGAGISHPYLFRLYRTKKALFLACLERCHERLHETFTRAAEAAGDGDRIEAMGRAYVDLLADREMLLLQLQGYAACDDDDVREASSGGYASLWALVQRLSGAGDDEVRAFFATGMLLNVAAAMELPQIAGDPGWALAHLRGRAEPAAGTGAGAIETHVGSDMQP